MAEAATAKQKPAKREKYMLVRHGRMNALGFFEHRESRIPMVPARVIIKTEKGLELGRLIGQLAPYKAGHFRLSREQIKRYFDSSNIDLPCEPTGKFVRYATAEDISEERHLRKITEEEIAYCRDLIKELQMPMKIVDAEHIFGGERVIFYFASDSRVDFRELVKKLARQYQTRIEMRQIGSRDEAKLLADYETCGQQCCCQRFLKVLKPVNMRMAKMQKATLDPSKISGYCGRLKCCLRYEDETYAELKKRLPRRNSRVKSKYGEGKVIDTQILTQLVMVEKDDGTRIAVPVDELEIISLLVSQKKKRGDTTDNEGRDTEDNENQ